MVACQHPLKVGVSDKGFLLDRMPEGRLIIFG